MSPYFNLPRPNGLSFGLMGRGPTREADVPGVGATAVVVDDDLEVQPRAAAAAVNPEMIERRPRGQEVAEEAQPPPPRQRLPPPPQEQQQGGSPFSRMVPRFSHFFSTTTASSVSWTSRHLSRSTGSHYSQEDDAPSLPHVHGREDIESPKTPCFRIAEQELPSTSLYLPQLARTLSHGSNGPPSRPSSHEHRPRRDDYDMSRSSDEEEDVSSHEERPDDIESHRSTEPQLVRASPTVAVVGEVGGFAVPPPAVPADHVRTAQTLRQRLRVSQMSSLFRGGSAERHVANSAADSRRRQQQQERRRPRIRHDGPPQPQQQQQQLSSIANSNENGSSSREGRHGNEQRKKKPKTTTTQGRRHANDGHRRGRERRERRRRPATDRGPPARRPPPKRFMFCFPWIKSKRVRTLILRCSVSGLLLVLLLTVYLALSVSHDVDNSEFTVVLLLMILAITICFCYGLIRLCMLVIARGADKKGRSRSGSQSGSSRGEGGSGSSGLRGAQVPNVYGIGGYAIPRHPIRVVLARDEEAAGIESETTKIQPPAYGLWRESVRVLLLPPKSKIYLSWTVNRLIDDLFYQRVDPDRIYWQRTDAPPLPQHSSSGGPTMSLDRIRGGGDIAVASGASGPRAAPSSYPSSVSSHPASFSAAAADGGGSGSHPNTPRPPSYVSEDGVSYVADAQPRPIAPAEAEVVQVPAPLMTSAAGVAAGMWNYHQHQHQHHGQHSHHPSEAGREGWGSGGVVR